jgi:two-component system LytT family sensor kinase
MRLARPVLIVTGVWLLVASVFIAQNIAVALGRHEAIPWLQAATFEVEYWFVFLLATPFLVQMARRYRFEPDQVRPSLLAHAIGGIVFALVQPVATAVLEAATLLLLRTPPVTEAQLFTSFAHRYAFLVIVAFWKYGVVIAVVDAFDYQRQARRHEVRAARLERAFAEAQLGALRMQLQPHFLFNALHSASVLALTDQEGAHHMLTRLADLLRETLDAAPDAEVTLAEELDFLDRYLAIEQARFDGRVTVAFEVVEEAELALVPSLILQPLVENAVHHAFARYSNARTLIVRAVVEGMWLKLEVDDDGPGLPAQWTFDGDARTGLKNVQARVDLANCTSRPLEFVRLAPSGLRVRLYLRRRDAEPSAA